MGVLFYASLLVLLITGWTTRRSRAYQLAALLTLFGFLTSLWLIYLQFFVLHALCSFCLGSAIISTLLFIFGARFLWRKE